VNQLGPSRKPPEPHTETRWPVRHSPPGAFQIIRVRDFHQVEVPSEEASVLIRWYRVTIERVDISHIDLCDDFVMLSALLAANDPKTSRYVEIQTLG